MFPEAIDWSDPADITHWLDCLRQKLRTGHSGVDEQLREAAIVDALVHYERHPECFDASRGSLSCYLWWRARHYLDKQLQKEKGHCKHEKEVGVSEKNFEKIVSEMRGRGGIYLGKDRTEQETEERRKDTEWRRQALDAIVASLNPHDRAGVKLLRTGASHQKWVRYLGIEGLPREEQQGEVNKEKERLKIKLKRRAQKMQGGGGRSQDRTQVRTTRFDAGGESESWLTQRRMLQSQQVRTEVRQKRLRNWV